ncbi:hypothetical protein E3T23_00470 [Cryobacterium cheniae]|uniref:Uncharacterized protein n=1 Tax=Cryobacterium cheniae TaxID=1259262 RepID=A0A4R8XXG2_9MICO|nr:hypothetical protein [Cryobacterium cheniae]TFC84210.1 hypothetical protein E3T23_00470 [Cryobacterium cheniae]
MQSAIDNPEATWAERWSESWDGFFSNWLAPLESPGLAILGLSLAALVLARLLAFVPLMWRGKTSQHAIDRLKGWGLGLILGGSAVFVLFAGGPGVVWVLAYPGALMMVAGMVGFSRGLATDRKISVEVRDEAGQPAETRTRNVMVLLTSLAGSRPKGLYFAIGSDVAFLSDSSLSGVVPNRVLAALQAIATFMIGSTPWRLSVDATNPDNLAVSMSRHGRQIDAATINRSDLGLARLDGGDTVDLDKFVAAFALMILSTQYTDVEGLAGTGSWRSLGLHFVASTDLRDDASDARAIAILSHAVDLDPDNHPASLMLQYRLHRYGTEFDELRRYADWLSVETAHLEAEHSPTQDADFSLHYHRVLLNYVITVENLVSVTDRPSGTSTSTDAIRARESALELVRLIDAGAGERNIEPGEVSLLKRKMRLVAATGYVALGGSQDLLEIGSRIKEAGISASPWVRYDLGCMFHAQSQEQTDPTRKAELRELALGHLEYAMIAPRPRSFVWKDPMLTQLHADPRFQKLAGNPRTDFWDLNSLQPYRTQFADLGITSPFHLSTLVGSRSELGDFLGAGRLQTLALLGISELANRAEVLSMLPWSEELLSRYRVELVSEIIAEGILSAAELGNLGEQERDLLSTKVFRALARRYDFEEFDLLQVAGWVDALVP